MLYDYECSECKYFMEDVYQSIKDDALTKCPKCEKETLERVITGGLYGHVYQEPTTLGQQADKNWRKKGHYERSNAMQKEDDKAKAKRESRKMINRLNKEHQYHYIMTGEMKR
jgi:putative FmdB family regulatory protein